MAARPNTESSGKLSFHERRRDSSAPPGIEFIFYGIFAGFIIAACAIAYYTAKLLKKTLKITLGPLEISIIVAFFILSFYASTLVLQNREDGATASFIGSSTVYEGAYLHYGFPLVWYRTFESYDSSFKFTSLENSLSFFLDLTLWLVVSVALVCYAKSLAAKRRRSLLRLKVQTLSWKLEA
jgi:hypothetical protein